MGGKLNTRHAEEKVAIARRHLAENVSVSDLCEQFGSYVTQYYAWQKQPFENGKLERYHRTNKSDCIRPGTPLTVKDAQSVVTLFVEDYNERRWCC